jgi:hypothetical protein
MKKFVLSMTNTTKNFMWNAKERTKEVLSNNKGDVNYPLTVAMFSVIILVFGYPILKSIVTTIFGDIQTWWNNNGSKIFDEVVQQ